MSFLDKFTSKFASQKEVPEYFLALNLGPNSIEAAIFGQVMGKVKVLGEAQKNYNSQLDLTQKAAETIDQAAGLSGVDFSKVVFGLPSDWIEDEKVISPYGQLIKKLAKDLDLEPLAFVSTQAAIAHLIEVEEFSPPTCILVGCFNKQLSVSFVKAGKIAASKTIARLSQNIGSEITDAVTSLKDLAPMPARIIIFGSEDLEKINSEINSLDWTKLPSDRPDMPLFLHVPKVEVKALGTCAIAVVFAGATDLGLVTQTRQAENQIITPNVVHKENENLQAVENNLDSDDFGFVEGEDVSKKEETKAVTGETKAPEVPVFAKEDIKEETAFENNNEDGVTVENSFLGWTEKIKDFFSGRNLAMLIPLFAIILIFTGIILVYWFLPKADVAIKVRSQTLDKETEIVASQDVSDVGTNQIPATTFDIEQSGSQKAVATGKKTVGDKAKGDVTVFNKTTAPKSFEAGTILSAPGGIKFSIDSSITIASRSSTIEGITYGKIETTATALAFGSDSNIVAGQDLTVADFDHSLYIARNEKAFSGGTSREVTVVSEEDLERLQSSLEKDLFQKAQEEIKSSVSEGQKILEEAVIKEVVTRNFDKDVGDEASVVNLDLEIKFKVVVVKESDLENVLNNNISDQLPQGFDLAENSTKFDITVGEVEPDGTVNLKMKYTASLVPKIDISKVKKDLIGKKIDVAQSYLSSLPDVISAEISVKPRFPGPLYTLPRAQNNINITLIPQD